VRELRMLGSVRGALSNGRPYRDKSLRDARQILRASPMQKGHSEELGSLRVASMGAALRADTSQVDTARGQVLPTFLRPDPEPWRPDPLDS
jgi:hypothetical protein